MVYLLKTIEIWYQLEWGHKEKNILKQISFNNNCIVNYVTMREGISKIRCRANAMIHLYLSLLITETNWDLTGLKFSSLN